MEVTRVTTASEKTDCYQSLCHFLQQQRGFVVNCDVGFRVLLVLLVKMALKEKTEPR